MTPYEPLHHEALALEQLGIWVFDPDAPLPGPFSPMLLDIAAALDVLDVVSGDFTACGAFPATERFELVAQWSAEFSRAEATKLASQAEIVEFIARVKHVVACTRERIANAGGRLTPIRDFGRGLGANMTPRELGALIGAEIAASRAAVKETYRDGEPKLNAEEIRASHDVDEMQSAKALSDEEEAALAGVAAAEEALDEMRTAAKAKRDAERPLRPAA